MTELAALAPDWPEISQVLDDALALPAGERAAWLASQTALTEPVRQVVLQLLARQAGIETGDFLSTLPPLGLGRGAGPGSGAGWGEPAPDAVVGPWRLVRELGQGGMGSVWLAERADGSLKRQVALKLPRLSWARGLAERMARERDILASLEHPHIARLYDAGVDEAGRPWLALEYVQGKPIDAHCRDADLPVARRVDLLLQVCAAVAYAHTRLVIHRDLKPGNILVGDDGQVRLLDFGIAKLLDGERTAETALTLAAGRALTLDYASPEQVRGEPLSTASDVYSLGVVAYELLAGTRPYKLKRGSAAELEEAIQQAEAPLASAMAEDASLSRALRGDLDAVLNTALKKTSTDRYPTVDALAQDLRRHLAGEAVAARADTLVYRLSRLLRQHARPLGAAGVALAALGLALGAGAMAVVLLALLVGLALALWQAQRAREQARQARAQAARAQAVQGFLLDIFRVNSDQQAAPMDARATTARDLLDRGAQRVDEALRSQPEARLEVMAVIGDMYYQLGEDEAAADIERRALGLLRQLVGPNDRRLAAALVKLAAALHGTRWRDEIVPALREAEQILNALGEHDSTLRGELFSRLAQRHQNISLPKMLDYATQAVRVLQAQPDEDPGQLSTALHLSARAHVLNGRLVEGDRLYEKSMEALARCSVPSHVALAQARAARGEGLIAQGRSRAAAQCLAEGAEAAFAALGPGDTMVAVLRSRLAHALHLSARREEARAMHRDVVAGVLASRGEHDTLDTPLVRMDWARSLQAEGALEASLVLVEQVNASNRVHYDGSIVLAGGLRMQAALLTDLGELDAAAALLDEAGTQWKRGTSGGVPAWRENRYHLDRARLALARGDAMAARAAAALVEPPGPQGSPLRLDETERDLLLARAALAQGEAQVALSLATAALQEVERSDIAFDAPAMHAEARVELARALVAAGRAADALVPAQAAVAWRRAHDDPNSPWTAQAELALAAVHSALGQTSAAQDSLQQARGRLQAQARLGPHLQFREALDVHR
jgi:eukaryotic-like serine/threonine-protein kinase